MMMVWTFTDGRRERDHEQAEAEEGGEDQADDGVVLEPGDRLQREDRGGGEQPGDEGAGGEGEAEHVGAGDARHDGVRERVADQHQPFSIRKAERKPQTQPTRPETQMALTM